MLSFFIALIYKLYKRDSGLNTPLAPLSST